MEQACLDASEDEPSEACLFEEELVDAVAAEARSWGTRLPPKRNCLKRLRSEVRDLLAINGLERWRQLPAQPQGPLPGSGKVPKLLDLEAQRDAKRKSKAKAPYFSPLKPLGPHQVEELRKGGAEGGRERRREWLARPGSGRSIYEGAAGARRTRGAIAKESKDRAATLEALMAALLDREKNGWVPASIPS